MTSIPVTITRYVSDDPQPGIVECRFIDADGKECVFIEKTAIVSRHYLDAESTYPQPGYLYCHVIARRLNGRGDEVLSVDVDVVSLGEKTRFEILASQMVNHP